jgi:hypothetical protein
MKYAEAEQRREAEAAAPVFAADTRRLSESEIRAVETFLNRRFELGEPNRTALAMRIAHPISTKLGISPDSLTAERLLEEVARQHRIQSRYVD